jgi:AraC-like DNA-binding protein
LNIGISNLSNFAKAFKKEFGILPKEMLKSR